MPKYPGYHTVKEAVGALGASKDIVKRLIRIGLFNVTVVGDQLRLLPDNEIPAAKAFLKMSPIEQLRITRQDATLILAETAGKLIGVSRHQIRRLRKKGRFPKAIGRVVSGAKAYRATDIITIAKRNNMWYDKKLARELGVKQDSSASKFNPIVNAKGSKS